MYPHVEADVIWGTCMIHRLIFDLLVHRHTKRKENQKGHPSRCGYFGVHPSMGCISNAHEEAICEGSWNCSYVLLLFAQVINWMFLKCLQIKAKIKGIHWSRRGCPWTHVHVLKLKSVTRFTLAIECNLFSTFYKKEVLILCVQGESNFSWHLNVLIRVGKVLLFVRTRSSDMRNNPVHFWILYPGSLLMSRMLIAEYPPAIVYLFEIASVASKLENILVAKCTNLTHLRLMRRSNGGEYCGISWAYREWHQRFHNIMRMCWLG